MATKILVGVSSLGYGAYEVYKNNEGLKQHYINLKEVYGDTKKVVQFVKNAKDRFSGKWLLIGGAVWSSWAIFKFFKQSKVKEKAEEKIYRITEVEEVINNGEKVIFHIMEEITVKKEKDVELDLLQRRFLENLFSESGSESV